MRARLTVLLFLVMAGVAKPQAASDEARLLRFPAVHGDSVVFTYAGNLYTVPADGGVARRWEPARNEAASPFRYRVHRDDLYRLTVETDDADEVFWAIVHSHVRSPAVPSPTDVGAATYPDALYILVSLAEDEADAATERPSVRAWRIVDKAIHEVEVSVTA